MKKSSRIVYDITSVHNPTVKTDLHLHKRRCRNAHNTVSIEGFHEFKHVYDLGIKVERLYICPDHLKQREISFLQEISDVIPIRIPPELMKKLSYRQHPDAWYAILRWKPSSLEECRPKIDQYNLYIVVENVEKPGNLGAIMRSADCSGVRAVINSNCGTDLRNPNVVRASKGALFSVHCAEVSNEEALDWFHQQGITIVLADPFCKKSLWEIKLPRSLALVLGAEKEGLSSFWKHAVEMRIGVPMMGTINSLNVAQTGTIIMYEMMRQFL